MQFWQLLRGDALEGFRFRRQQPIDSYVLDFYSAETKLAVEIDGAAHDVPDIAAHNIVRGSWLRERGIRVLRLPAMDVLKPSQRESVLDTIAAALQGED